MYEEEENKQINPSSSKTETILKTSIKKTYENSLLIDSYIKEEVNKPIKTEKSNNEVKSIKLNNLSESKYNSFGQKSFKTKDSDIFPDESKRIKMIGPYLIECLIGKGSFGKVYKCSKDGIKYALKIELTSISTTSQLKNEYMIYKKLKGINGIPKIYALGEHDDCYYMVMELLGMNLHRIHELRILNFSTALVLKIGLRLLEIFEEVHEKGIIIRDLKPDNILVNKEDIYLIDLGMSKYYIKGNKHIAKRKGKELAGTVRYASIYTHLGIEQSRRDDLETMIYSLIYLCKNKLPWMGIIANNRKEKFYKIWKKKEETSIKYLIKDIPNGEVLGDTLKYVRNLEFEEKPNYLKIKTWFKNTLKEIGESSTDFNFKKEKEELKRKEEKPEIKKEKEEFWMKLKKTFCCCFI